MSQQKTPLEQRLLRHPVDAKELTKLCEWVPFCCTLSLKKAPGSVWMERKRKACRRNAVFCKVKAEEPAIPIDVSFDDKRM
ncbi:MAG: hypothetical protein UGF45_02235 [Massilioclostridium sp.]|nr:hypothetical protein [Massilioclostridium sp.]MEE1490853.1 hypothetical protein [Massilioclostridium sp.]